MAKRSLFLASSLSLLWLAGCSDVSLPMQQIDQTNQPGKSGVVEVSRSSQQTEYRLRMHHLHTGEWIDVVYRQGNTYIAQSVAQLNHFLRDHRTGQNAHYPVREFDLLHAVMQKLGDSSGTIDIVCGYRSPWSNEFLRSRGAHTGVAEHSEHELSQAVDIRVPGISTERLRDAALSLHLGGVGYYPVSRFVHVDIGPVRSWTFGTSTLSRAAHHPAHLQHRSRPA